MQILIPKTYRVISEIQKRIFFLAGPIDGGGDWQARMCREIGDHSMDVTIASPKRWTTEHQLAPFFEHDDSSPFDRQLEWERYYLELAGEGTHIPGCIIFWLPCESVGSPHPGPGPYAMDTRGELGEWRWRMKTEGARVVIGAEPGFFGLSQIQRNFSAVLGYDFPIHRTMKETVSAAFATAARK